jgi:hypothetical protein
LNILKGELKEYTETNIIQIFGNVPGSLFDISVISKEIIIYIYILQHKTICEYTITEYLHHRLI